MKSRYRSRKSKGRNLLALFSLFIKVGLPISLIAGVVFLLNADFLQIKSVSVIGNEREASDKLASAVLSKLEGKSLLVVPKTNFLFIKKESLEKEITDDFPRIEKATINKNLDGILEIAVTERRGDFLWCASTGFCYLMNEEGLVFVPASADESDGRIIFEGAIRGDPTLKQFATPEKMQDYIKVISMVHENSIKLNSINAESSNKSVVRTEIGDIFLNPEENMAEALPNALLLIRDIKARIPNARFEYVDARYGKKLFYKLIE